jgi:hypothetical protein
MYITLLLDSSLYIHGWLSVYIFVQLGFSSNITSDMVTLSRTFGADCSPISLVAKPLSDFYAWRWSGNSSKWQLIEAATHRMPYRGPFHRKIFMKHHSPIGWQLIEHPYSAPIHRIYYKM